MFDLGGQKFGRKYRLLVQTVTGDILTIEPPFTVEFDITRNILTSANVASIRVFNLSATHRDGIRKNVNDVSDLRIIRLEAGYGGNLPVIFEGNITQAWSVREGVSFITQMESFDGGFAFANASSSITAPAGTPQMAVVLDLVKDLAANGVLPGTIGPVDGVLSRGNAYAGNTCNLLRELTGGRFFIDNGKANILADNECIPGLPVVINAASGLLDTPVQEQTIITFTMLFEPKLLIGQQIFLVSATNPKLNHDYKVVALKHRGTISEAVAGDATTIVTLFYPLGVQGLRTVGAA